MRAFQKLEPAAAPAAESALPSLSQQQLLFCFLAGRSIERAQRQRVHVSVENPDVRETVNVHLVVRKTDLMSRVML